MQYSAHTIYLPVFNSNQSFTFQITGNTSQDLNISFLMSSPVHTAYGVYTDLNISSYFFTPTILSIYICTFYLSSGNPWGDQYPSYAITTAPLDVNYLQLVSNVDQYLFYTNTFNNIIGQFLMPATPSHGQIIRFIDANDSASCTTVTLYTSSNNTIDYSSNNIQFTNGTIKQYIYIGTGSNGKFLSI